MVLRPKFREDMVPLISRFISDYFNDWKREAAVIGLSGGVDSALVARLCADALKPSRVHAIHLPEEQGSEGAVEAMQYARSLGLRFEVMPIGPLVKAFEEYLKAEDNVPLGNIKARIRMILLYHRSRELNGVVVGTGNKSELATGYFCYDEQTRVLTPYGPKYYWELKLGTTVFSLDPRTCQVTEVPLGGVHVFDYDGILIEIRTELLDLLVTPNHRLLISNKNGGGPLGFATAESRLEEEYTALATPTPWEGTTAALGRVDMGEFFDEPELGSGFGPLLEGATGDPLYVLGVLTGGGGMDIRMAGEAKGNSSKALAVRACARQGGDVEILLHQELAGRGDTQWLPVASAPPVGSGFRDRQEQIPPWVLRLPAEDLGHLYRGLLDGHGNAGGSACSTTSVRLAYQLVELGAKLGLHVSVRQPRWKVTGNDGAAIRPGPRFEVKIEKLDGTLGFTREDVRRVPYKGRVWCPSVPPHENVLVERNGRTVFCGNTKYGDGGVDILPIGDLYKTQVWEMARHLGLPAHIVDKVPTAGLWRGQTDEEELGMSYRELDSILLGLEMQLDEGEIVRRADVPLEGVRRVQQRMRQNLHKRKMPLIPKLGIRTFGLDWRE